MQEFKTSQCWILGFMKRYRLALRRRTRISQKLSDKTRELLESFYDFITNLRIEKCFELKNIFNMDETPVWFDMTGVYTVNVKGEKTVYILSGFVHFFFFFSFFFLLFSNFNFLFFSFFLFFFFLFFSFPFFLLFFFL